MEAIRKSHFSDRAVEQVMDDFVNSLLGPDLFGQSQILLVELGNLGACRVDIAVILDNVIRQSRSVLSVGLRGNHTPSLLRRFFIAAKQPLQLDFLAAIDNQDSIDAISQGRFNQKRNDDNLIVATHGLHLWLPLFC